MANAKEQREAMVRLLAAEAEFLRTMSWIPLAPAVRGGPVLWRSPSGQEVQTQHVAVLEAKSEWVQLYER